MKELMEFITRAIKIVAFSALIGFIGLLLTFIGILAMLFN
jgi:hypothetical protein